MYDPEMSALPGLPLRVGSREIPVPLRDALPERSLAAEQLQAWKDRLQSARERGDAPAVTEAIYMARRADIQLRMADDFGGRASASVRAHLLAFGDVALVGCNIEPFCETGLAIKRQSPYPVTFMSGYTNGRMAYLATRKEWAKGGYEVENSPFGESAADVLEQEILGALRKLRAT
jgi:hypothetical protein